jgi:glutathione S-transferase
MRLHYAKQAPNPDRVRFFLQEKGAWGQVEIASISIMEGEHRSDAYRALSPFGHVPALEIDGGLTLTESRAICTYLEGVYPEPNLMGVDARERAVIEMWDRRVELSYLAHIAGWVRHGHPALVALESPQCAEWARLCEGKARGMAPAFDARLAASPFLAGDRFTIADITLHVALGFGRMMKFRPWEELPALSAWRDRVAARPGMQ